jgi:hypothetical protein
MAKDRANSKPTAERLMLAYLCTTQAKNLREKVDILDRFGLSDSEIAKVCKNAVQAVRNARLANRKAR